MTRLLAAIGCALVGIPVGTYAVVPILGAQTRRQGASVHPEWVGWAVGLTVVSFAGMGARFGGEWELPAFLVLAGSLVAVSLVDLRYFIVPNRVVAATLVASAPLLVLAAAASHRWGDLGRAAIGAVLASGVLLAMNLLNPHWMGMGDVKLAVVLGLFLGWLGLGHVAAGLFLGFLAGAVIGAGLLVSGRRTRRDHLPFAPFLALGAIGAVLVGRQLIDWYTR